MKLGTRIFLCSIALVAICLIYPLNKLADSIITYYREGVEDILVDEANILAAIVEDEIRRGGFKASNWQDIFASAHSRQLPARIYDLQKNSVDSEVYITDAKGLVLFDSESSESIGMDFSHWRDVFLTLQGKYGARATKREHTGEQSSTMYVAAPIYVDGNIHGVLTVVKPTANILYFVQGARRDILKLGMFSLAAAGVLAFLITFWITRPVKRLTAYARSVSAGKTVPFPALGRGEIGEMGEAFASMQETLEGKRYVEQYVEHLTHELKSPLSAINGAAELLADPTMDAAQRVRFTGNIMAQSRRMQLLVDKMLELASLESGSYHLNMEDFDGIKLLRTLCAEKEALLAQIDLKLQLDTPDVAVGCHCKGDVFLLRQALDNLLQNALEFSPRGSKITVSLSLVEGRLLFCVQDEGPGVPDYAKDKAFEKFFSLQRPQTGQKSTGLGLSFVRQVAALHGGRATLENCTHGGALAKLELPQP